MLQRLLQAASLTFLLNLLAYINPPNATQSNTVLPSEPTPKLVLIFE
jgi:hypothetical protein